MADWAEIGRQVEQILANNGEPFDLATMANARELLSVVRDRCPAPTVCKGYWSTIIFFWDVPPRGFDIEVFDDRFELYRFFEGETDIKHIAHRPGEPYPIAVIDELPTSSVRRT